MDYNTI